MAIDTGDTKRSKLARGIGLRIMERRTALDMTRVDLATLMGMDWQNIERYENGRALMSVTKLQRFAVILKCTVQDLLP